MFVLKLCVRRMQHNIHSRYECHNLYFSSFFAVRASLHSESFMWVETLWEKFDYVTLNYEYLKCIYFEYIVVCCIFNRKYSNIIIQWVFLRVFFSVWKWFIRWFVQPLNDFDFVDLFFVVPSEALDFYTFRMDWVSSAHLCFETFSDFRCEICFISPSSIRSYFFSFLPYKSIGMCSCDANVSVWERAISFAKR